MSALSEAIKDLYVAVETLKTSLDPVIEHMDVIESVEERRANTNAVLASINRDHDIAARRLAAVRGELERTEKAYTEKTHLINDEKARTLRDTQGRIVDAQTHLDLLNTQIHTKQQEHDAIVASMNSLAKRLKVGE